MAGVISFIRSTKLVYILFWIAWMMVYAFVLHRLGFGWEISIYDSLVSNISLGLICLVIGNIILYYQPSKNTAWKLILWCLLAATFWNWLSQWILSKVYSGNTEYLKNLSESFPIRFALGFLILGCTVLVTWVLEFVAFKNEDTARQASAIALAKEAELSGLTQQLQPHFLFNSLNSISALIGSRPQEARTMIQQLSDFLRGTLKRDNKQLVALEEEMKHLQLYLDIEKVRFGHRLSTQFQFDEVSLNLLLPPLILQPIVENAIKFGVYDTIEAVEIKIECISKNNMLKISIQNPFDPDTSVNSKGTGFGLKSIGRRLFLIYARNDLLETVAEKNLFITTVSFPQAL